MNLRGQFDELRARVEEMQSFVSSAEFSSYPLQQRLLFNEQLAAMERQSVALSELINLSDGLEPVDAQ